MTRALEARVHFTLGSHAHDMDPIGRSFPANEFLTQLRSAPDHIWTPQAENVKWRDDPFCALFRYSHFAMSRKMPRKAEHFT